MSIYSPDRRKAADTYLPMQRQILSTLYQCDPEAICESSLTEDMCEGTDLIMPSGDRVAVRVRSKCYGDVAFRDSRDSRRLTEWDKLLSGITPDRYLYCCGTEEKITAWWFLDVSVIREAHKRGWTRCTTYRKEPYFGDGVVLVGLTDYPTKYGNRNFILAEGNEMTLLNKTVSFISTLQ